MIKNTNCAKGMTVLRGPHVIKCAELCPSSKMASQGADTPKHLSMSLVVLCFILASCVSIQNSVVLYLAFS